MIHAQKDKKIEDISNYNTFKVFEDIYNKEGSNDNYSQITLPIRRKKSYFGLSLLIFVFVLGVLGVGLHPALSYLLKTPYPLLVVTESTMQPVIDQNDLVLVRGVISQEEIKTNDLIVFNQILDNNQNLAVQRVVEIDKDKGQLIVKGETDDSLSASIAVGQVIGKVVGEDSPVKFSLIGKMIGYLARR